jgi:transposase InsO family protein
LKVLGNQESWNIMVNKHYPAAFKADAVALYRSRPGARSSYYYWRSAAPARAARDAADQALVVRIRAVRAAHDGTYEARRITAELHDDGVVVNLKKVARDALLPHPRPAATPAGAGWAIADHIRTDLVIDALTAAAQTRGSLHGTIFHSDHGAQLHIVPLRGTLAEQRNPALDGVRR